MKHLAWPVGLLAGSLLACGPAAADILNFTAVIDEAQAGACVGTASPGTGIGAFTLDTDTGDVNYSITFSGLLGTETMAHVHGAAPECVNAGIVYALPLGSPKNGTATLTAQQMQDMIDGLHYVNIHTDREPGGEIRGQILPVPPTTAFGLPQSPLGQAQLALDPATGSLVISNIGSSGEDGVSIDLGQADGFEGTYLLPPAGAWPTDGAFGITPINLDGSHDFEIKIQEVAGQNSVIVEWVPAGLHVDRVDLFLDDAPVDSVEFPTPAGGPLVVGNIGSSGLDGVSVGIENDLQGSRTIATVELPAPSSLTIFGSTPQSANKFKLFIPDGTPVRAKVSVKFKEFTPAEEQRQRTKFHAHDHESTGGATTTGVADLNGDGRPDLVVGNIGSSGQDGVHVDVRHGGGRVRPEVEVEKELIANFDPIVLDLAGKGVAFTVFGELGGGGTPEPMCRAYADASTSQWAYIGLEALNQTNGGVDVYPWSGGVWTGVLLTILTPDLGTVTAAPGNSPKISDFGMSRSYDGNDGLDEMVFFFSEPVTFSPSDGSPDVLCDSLHLVPLAPAPALDEYTGLDVRGTDLSSLTVLGSTTHSTQFISGLSTQNAGVTVRGWDPVKKEAIIGNIGSSGQDGVDVGLGEADGWGGEFDFRDASGDFPGGGSFVIDVIPFNDAPALSVPMHQTRSGAGSGGSIWLNGAPLATGQVTVRGYAGNAMVYEQLFTPPLPVDLFDLPNATAAIEERKKCFVNQFDTGLAPRSAGGGAGGGGNVVVRFDLLDTTGDAIVAGENIGPLDALEMIYEDPSAPAPVNPRYAGIRMRAAEPSPQTREHILLGRQVGMLFGNVHEGLGQARHVYQHNVTDLEFLRVSNIGSSGEDGVRLQAEYFALQNQIQQESRKFQTVIRSNVNDGNNENWDFTGRSGTETSPGSTEISSAQLIVSGGNRDAVVGPIPWMAPESITTRVYDGGALVGETSGLLPGVVATAVTPTTPGSYEFELIVNDSTGLPEGVRHTFIWDTAHDIMLPGAAGPVTGAKVEVTALSAEGRSMGGSDFELDHIDFTITGLAGDVSVDILDEVVTWIDTCSADSNASGIVNVVDLLDLLGKWGPCPGSPDPCHEDNNSDGSVTVVDLLNLLGQWGPCP